MYVIDPLKRTELELELEHELDPLQPPRYLDLELEHELELFQPPGAHAGIMMSHEFIECQKVLGPLA